MSGRAAHAKINLSLVVGPLRPDGKHEVATVLQKVELHDDVELEAFTSLAVEGYPDDTLVTSALGALAERAGILPLWRVRIEKRIPVTAGLGGGSSDAAAALELANSELASPLSRAELHRVAAEVGADVPFFLYDAPQLGTADGTDLQPLALPLDYYVLLLVPDGASKESTAAVYRAFDERGGERGFEERRAALLAALEHVAEPRDLAQLPRNDLASSPLVPRLEDLGAFRADVSGAGPALYALFDDEQAAERARSELSAEARTWLTRPL